MCRHQYHKVVIKFFNKRNYNLPNFICLLSITVVHILCFCDLLAVQDWESQFTLLCLSHRRRKWRPILVLLPGKIPWTKEPGRLQSMGSLGSDTTERLHFHFHFHAMEKEMATHSSVLAWRIPGTEEPRGLPSMGSHRVGQDYFNLIVEVKGYEVQIYNF